MPRFVHLPWSTGRRLHVLVHMQLPLIFAIFRTEGSSDGQSESEQNIEHSPRNRTSWQPCTVQKCKWITRKETCYVDVKMCFEQGQDGERKYSSAFFLNSDNVVVYCRCVGRKMRSKTKKIIQALKMDMTCGSRVTCLSGCFWQPWLGLWCSLDRHFILFWNLLDFFLFFLLGSSWTRGTNRPKRPTWTTSKEHCIYTTSILFCPARPCICR